MSTNALFRDDSNSVSERRAAYTVDFGGHQSVADQAGSQTGTAPSAGSARP
jgi:hypothetical protein